MAPPDPPPSSGESSDLEPHPETGQINNSKGIQRDQEQPWSLEEMRKNAAAWSLAGDAGLLSYLQEFSQKMISKTHEIEKSVDSLIHDAKLSNVKALNVTNDFIMLANAQFVENRVYDEDISQEDNTAEEKKKTEEQEKTREQREAALVPKITEALKYGLNVIDQAFEKLDSNIDDSESEDEETTYKVDPILEPKDPYISRPLPYLIGSGQFLQDDNVGLVDEPSEDEEETDHGSISESESEEEEKKDEESSEEYTETESESGSEEEIIVTKKSKSSVRKRDESDSSEGDLFGEKDNTEDESADEKEDVEESEKMQAPKTGFAAELAAKIGVAPPKSLEEHNEDQMSDDDDDGMIQEKKHKSKRDKSHSVVSEKKHKSEKKEKRKRTGSKAKHDDDDLFGPNVEDDDDPFTKKGGLFSSSKGLFDSEGEDSGGLFGDTEQVEKKTEHKEKTKSRKHSKKKSETVAEDDDEDEDSNKIKSVADGGRTVSSSVNSRKMSGNLFEDDDDDDLFAPVSQKQSFPKTKHTTQAPTKTTAPRKSSMGLFGEDEEEDLFPSVTKDEVPIIEEPAKPKKKTKSLPAGAVSMFGGAPNPLAAALKKQQQDSEEEDDDDWMEDKKSRSGSLKSNQSTASSASLNKRSLVNQNKDVSPALSSNSLFAEEPDDDLFKPKSKMESKPKSKPKVSLFEDDDDDFFGGGSSTKKETKKEVKPKSEPPDKIRVKSDSFFDEDEGEDLFGITSKPKESKNKPVGGVSLFGGVDVLGKKQDKLEEKKEDVPEPISPPPRKTTISLFDDDEQDEGDAFFGAMPSKPATQSKEKPKQEVKAKSMKKGLFDDEDILFGGAEESPDVDIFGSSSPVHSPTTESNTIKTIKPDTKSSVPIIGATTSASSSDMFNDDDEDLFSSSPAPVKQMAGPKTSGPLDIEGVTTTESSEQNSTDKEKITQKKKPVGGVSMFGGLDPKALKKTSKSEVKEEKKVDPLFNDEDDDLFGAPKSKPILQEKKIPNEVVENDKPSTEHQPEVPKRPVGGVSMFRSVKPPVPKDKAEVSSKNEKDPLFTNEDDDEDLFGIPKPAIQKKKPERTSSVDKPIPSQKPVTNESAPNDTRSIISSNSNDSAADKKGDLFGSIEEDDLFSKPKSLRTKSIEESAPETNITQKESSPDLGFAKPKKPPGAVSMFGGMDPFSGMKKKENSPVQIEVIANHIDDRLESGDDDHNKKSNVKAPKPVSPPASGKIGKLQASLAFNPATMLPGAAPPVSEPETVAVGFDEPAQAKTLRSDTKNRARIQSKRRPPSRYAREKASSGSDTIISPPITEDNISAASRVPDMFGNDDLFDGGTSTSIKNTNSSLDERFSSDNLFNKTSSRLQKSDDDDLFTSVATKVKTTNTTRDAKSSDSDDIFSSKPSAAGATGGPKNILSDDIFFSSDVGPSLDATPNSIAQNDDVSSGMTSSSKTEKSIKSNPPKKQSSVVDKNSDDIFNVIAPKTSDSKKLDDHSKTKPSLLEDDIFADSSVLKKKDTSDKNKKTVDLDEDDIFASSTKEKKPAKKKAVTKVEDMLKDDTDIFADIPDVKPKEKKKKKTTASSAKKTIFKSDIDDIFADTVISSKPKKETTKKQPSEKKEKKAEDITDIFDDPLSAIG